MDSELDFYKSKAFDFDYIKANAIKIHYFGLGFIQVKLNHEFRVHYYTNKFKITDGEEIHNHRYNFSSHILQGDMYNLIYNVIEDEKGQFVLRQESCNVENKIVSEPKSVRIEITSTQDLTKGGRYYMHHKTFHRVTCANKTITLIRRTDYEKDLADIVSPKNKELFCPFSVNVSFEEIDQTLYEIIQG